MSGDRTPTTLVGLDGVSWPLIEDLRERADVPTLARLADESVTGVTVSTIPSLTCPALPTFYTGKNAGNLGIFDFVKPDGGLIDYHDVTEPAIWDYLSEADVTSVVAAMRTTHPAPDIDGVFISDVLSTIQEPDYVTPPEARDYGDQFHDYREELERAKRGDDPEALLETFVEFNNRRADVVLELLDNVEPEFALLWFGLADGVQHFFWDDPDALATFFEELDDRLSEVLAARDGGNLVVVGDHGFGPATEYRFHVNDALRRAGFLELVGGPVRSKLVELAYRATEQWVSDAWKRRGLEVVNAVRSMTGTSSDDVAVDGEQHVVTPLNTLPGIDWDETRAHLSTRKGWGVNVVRENVDGDYDSFRREVIEALKRIEGPDGDPAVKAAWPGEEIYWGRYGDQVPDIVFLSHDKVRARPSVVGSLFTPQDSSHHVGSHESSREAIFMAQGPDVVDEGDIGCVELYDLLPTLLHLLGLPAPEHVDGEVRRDVVTGEPRTASYPVERYRVRKGLRRLPLERL